MILAAICVFCASSPGAKLFFPFTTTVIELRLDREPMPIGGESDICKIVWPEVKKDAVLEH